MTEFVNKFNGEVLPFRTPYNVEPDKGVKNELPDECVISDYIPINEQIKMFTPDDIMRIKALDNIEKELSDFDDDDLEDYVSEDELDTLTNLEELEPELFSEQEKFPQASKKTTTNSESEAKQADDASKASGGSAASSNVTSEEA